jgi:hypothetical protein
LPLCSGSGATLRSRDTCWRLCWAMDYLFLLAYFSQYQYQAIIRLHLLAPFQRHAPQRSAAAHPRLHLQSDHPTRTVRQPMGSARPTPFLTVWETPFLPVRETPARITCAPKLEQLAKVLLPNRPPLGHLAAQLWSDASAWSSAASKLLTATAVANQSHAVAPHNR